MKVSHANMIHRAMQPVPAVRDYFNSVRGGVATRLDTPWNQFGSYGSSLYDFGTYGMTLESIRARSRTLMQNNKLAQNVVKCHVDNVIGSGMGIVPDSGDEEFNAQAAEEWERWTSSTRCDFYRKRPWGRMQREVQRRKKTDGGCLVLLVNERGFPKQQIIRMSWLRNPWATRPDRIYRHGIEMDKRGRILAFHVQENRSGLLNAAVAPRRISWFDCIYLPNFDPEDHVAGFPEFTGGFTKFDQTDGYLDSVVVGSRVGASQAGTIEETPDLPTPGSVDENGNFVADDESEEFTEMEMEPGVFKKVPRGYKMNPWNPNQPTQQMPAAVKVFVQFCAMGWGVSPAQVMHEFTGMNYSVSRSDRLHIEREAEPERDDFLQIYLGRTYKWIIDSAIKRRAITAPPPPNYAKYQAIPHHWPMVDPTKDVPAAIKAIEARLDSRTRFTASIGRKFTTIIEQQEAEEKLMKSKKLMPVSSTKEDPPDTNTEETDTPPDDNSDNPPPNTTDD